MGDSDVGFVDDEVASLSSFSSDGEADEKKNLADEKKNLEDEKKNLAHKKSWKDVHSSATIPLMANKFAISISRLLGSEFDKSKFKDTLLQNINDFCLDGNEEFSEDNIGKLDCFLDEFVDEISRIVYGVEIAADCDISAGNSKEILKPLVKLLEDNEQMSQDIKDCLKTGLNGYDGSFARKASSFGMRSSFSSATLYSPSPNPSPKVTELKRSTSVISQLGKLDVNGDGAGSDSPTKKTKHYTPGGKG